MKNLIIGIAVGIIVGIGIGYLKWGAEEENGQGWNKTRISNFLESQRNRDSLAKYFIRDNPLAPPPPHLPSSIKISEGQKFINDLYEEIRKDQKFINNTINPSYVFDLNPMFRLALTHGDNLKDIQMRIYPVLRPNPDNGINEFSLVIGLESNCKLYNGDHEIFEFIGPCPKNCVREETDLLMHKDWIANYQKAFGRTLDFSSLIPCPKP